MIIRVGLICAGRMRPVFAEQIADLVNSIVEDSAPAVAGQAACAATVIRVAATRSLDENRPVLVSEI